MKVTALAGGVGGAKLSNGLSRLLSPESFSIIVNTGDDFEYSGLYICPDLDTVTYTLAGINDPVTGWGIKNDSRNVLSALEKIGHPIWFSLGDRDIATHLERTRLLEQGKSLTEITRIISSLLGVRHAILPMADSPVQTVIETYEYGEIPFQEYFVKYHFQPCVRGIRFEGIEKAEVSEITINTIETSDLIIICPSNPFVSIDPILSIPGLKQKLASKTIVAVSPLIGGKTVKGPAAKLMIERGDQPNSITVAKHYHSLIQGFVLDHRDHAEAEQIRHCGIIPLETGILMSDSVDQMRLAHEVLDFGTYLLTKDH